VGATCVGAPAVGADLVAAYTRHLPVPVDPAHLLLTAVGPTAAPAQSPAELPDDAPVCRCNGVSKGDLVGHWHAGARTLDDAVAATRATTGCGSCTAEVCGILDWLGSTRPASPGAAGPRENPFTSGKHAEHSAAISAQ
jgi:assimilatory nitrate reductase electron transfer subunit